MREYAGATADGKILFSFSRLSTFLRCGEQYRRRYRENQVVPPGIAQHTGSSVHVGAEANYRQKILSYADLPAADIQEISVETFKAGVRSGLLFTPDEEVIGKGKVLNQAEQKVLRMSELFAGKVAPDVQPIAVERKFRFPVGDVVLECHPDVITVTAEMRDLKVTNRHIEAHRDLQLTFQAETFRREFGRFPAAVRIDQLKMLKDQSVFVPHESRRDETDVEVMNSRLNAMLAAIKAEIFLPAPPDSWWCSAAYCGYFRSCPYAQRREG